MIVLREENEAGVLQRVIFRAEPAEDFATFKAAIKVWETANGIVANWEEFFDECEGIDIDRVTLHNPAA